jgi:hypothetical protein
MRDVRITLRGTLSDCTRGPRLYAPTETPISRDYCDYKRQPRGKDCDYMFRERDY